MNGDMRARADGPDGSDTDRRPVDVIRVLAMDAVEQAGSGFPGAGMSLAPAAHLHARVSIGAGITLRWRQYAGASVGPEHFGASADYRK